MKLSRRSISRFIETLQLKDGKFLNLEYHQERLNRTFLVFFPGKKAFLLEEILSPEHLPDKGRFRCTLNYSDHPGELNIVAYQPGIINRLIIREVDSLDYSWKYADRSELNHLTSGLAPDEEVIIIRQGKVTDASYANLIFFDGKTWVTPSTPLLPGTKRRKLLEEGIITEAEIRRKDLGRFSKCCLINAMLDPGEIVVRMTP